MKFKCHLHKGGSVKNYSSFVSNSVQVVSVKRWKEEREGGKLKRRKVSRESY